MACSLTDCRGTGERPHPTGGRRRRPVLECLEDRALLSTLSWQVQSDYFGVADGAESQPRSLRGLAVTTDGQNLYGGFIQGTVSSAIREVSTTPLAMPIGNTGGSPQASTAPNPPYTTGLEASVTTFNQAKGLATDGQGNVYATLTATSNSLSQQWAIYNSALTQQVAAETSTNYISSSTLSAIATAEVGGNSYVYVGWKNGQIERWNVNNPADPVLDTSWGSTAHPGTISLKSINSNAYLDGLTVDTDGTIYVAGGLLGTTSYGDSLIKIPAAAAQSDNLAAATSVSVQGGADGEGGYSAMGVALFEGQVYVTEYLASDSVIAVFNKSDLSSAGTITVPNPTGPSGLNATFPTGADSGFSGIAISPTGELYVAEQLYNSVTTSDSDPYAPPGGSDFPDGTTIDFDRVMVSSSLDTTAPVVTLTTPANGSVTNDNTPTFSGVGGTAAGDDSTLTVTIYQGSSTGGSVVETLTGVAVDPSTGDYSVVASPLLSDGTYTAQASQEDVADNVGTSSANTFTVDTTAPVVTLTTPANGSVTNDNTPTFSGVGGTAAGDDSTLTVTIYQGSSTGGSVVETLTGVAVDPSTGDYSVVASPLLSDGTYTAQASQEDVADNVGTSSANTFTVDTTAPVVTLTTPANGSVTNDNTPTFSGVGGTAAGDDSTLTVTIYQGSSTGGSVVETLTGVAVDPSTGDYSVVASPLLSDGTYTAQASQEDDATNVGYSSANTFTVDTTAPVVTLTTPANGSISSNKTPTFSGVGGTAAGDDSTVTVTIYAGPNTSGSVVETLTNVAVNPSTGAYSVVATSPLSNGTYTAQASQENEATSVGYSSANTFRINAPPLVVTLATPANGSATNDTTPTFSGTGSTAAGDNTTVTVTIYAGSSTGGSVVETLTNVPINPSTGAFSVAASSALSNGTYTAQAKQSDQWGDTAASTANTFRIDTIAPVVSLTTPANGSATNDNTPTFSGVGGTAVGDNSTVTVTIYNGSSTSGSVVETLTGVAVNPSTGAYSVVGSKALADGTYTVQAVQMDNAGNTGRSTANTFTIDTTAPMVTLTTPSYGSTTTNTRPTFSGTAGTATGDSTTVTIDIYRGKYVQGTPFLVLTAQVSGGKYSVTQALAVGTYTVQVIQTDDAGNTGRSSANTFTII